LIPYANRSDQSTRGNLRLHLLLPNFQFLQAATLKHSLSGELEARVYCGIRKKRSTGMEASRTGRKVCLEDY
jgi:hypothetical protein